MSEELPPWGQIQKRTFTRWCNVHLKDRKLKIDDLEKDFEDGVKLINLLEIISGKKINYNKNVKFYSQKLENVGKALKFVKDEGIKLVAIGPEDLVEKRIKLILGLIWTIILRYQINKVDYVEVVTGDPRAGQAVTQVKQKPEASNQDLLQWVNSVIPDNKVRNFKGDWKDGKALFALTNYLKPGIVDLSHSANLSPLDRATKAMDAASKELNIPQILEPTDMVSDQADDLSIMTYVSYFRDHDRKAKVVDPSKCKAYGPGLTKGIVGEDNVFTVKAKNAFGDQVRVGGSNIAVKVVNPENPSAVIPVTVHDHNDGLYTVNYTPKDTGKHDVYVLIDNTPIARSPFTVDAEKVVVASPAHSTIDKGPEVGPDGLTHFTVTTRDKSGNPVFDANANLLAKVVDPTDGTEAHVAVVPKEDGTYDVSIAPKKSGDYDVKIGLNDLNDPKKLIKGCPFKVALNPPVEKPKPINPEDVAVDLANLKKQNEDGSFEFAIKPKSDKVDLSTANFDVKIKDPHGQPIDAKVNVDPDGTFHVKFDPTDSGQYDFGVTLSDASGQVAELPGSPFTANLDVKPNKIDPAVEKAANETTVDLSTLGNGVDKDGKVHFNVVLPKDAPPNAKLDSKVNFNAEQALPTEIVPNADGTYSVFFKPEDKGDFYIDVQLVDENGFSAPVKDTPVKVKIESLVPVDDGKPGEDILKAAENSKVDLSPLNNGLDENGNLGFTITPADLPEGARILSNLTYLPQNLEIPSEIIPDGDNLKVKFQPVGSGEYLLEGFVVDKDGKKAKLKGTPVKLNLTVPEKSPAEEAVQKAAEESFVDFSGLSAEPTADGGVSFNVGVRGKSLPEGAKYDAKISFVPENSIVPSKVEDGGDGTFRVLFYPKHEEGPAEYLVSLNLLDKNGNAAKVRGGPYRVIVNIVRGPDMSGVEPVVAKAATEAYVDMKPLNAGPNGEGKLHYDIVNMANPLPSGSHIETKITLTADGSDVPVELKSNDNGTYSAFFKPTGTGVYMIEAVLVDRKDNGAPISKSPVRLTLNMGTAPPRSANAPDVVTEKAAENSKVDLSNIGKGINKDGNLAFTIESKDIPEGSHLDTTVVFVPDNLDLPCAVQPVGDGTYTVAFQPVRTGEYMIAANLIDKDGRSARLKGTPIRLLLNLPDNLAPPNTTQGVDSKPQSHANVEPQSNPIPAEIASAAENGKIDLDPIGKGFNEDGDLEFVVNAKIPENAKLEPKITFENKELPSTVTPLPDGKYKISFPPAGTGEYLLAANIGDKDGKTSARVKGTPVRLNLKLPDTPFPQPRAQHTPPAASTPSTPKDDFTPFTTSPTPTSHATLDPSLSNTSATPSLGHDVPSIPNSSASKQVEQDDTDEEHTVMWTHSFCIEAHTKRGIRKLFGGDKFVILITGPQGIVENVKVDDLGNGKYLVTYSLPGHGEYIIKATLNGRDIVGSPFHQKI